MLDPSKYRSKLDVDWVGMFLTYLAGVFMMLGYEEMVRTKSFFPGILVSIFSAIMHHYGEKYVRERSKIYIVEATPEDKKES